MLVVWLAMQYYSICNNMTTLNIARDTAGEFLFIGFIIFLFASILALLFAATLHEDSKADETSKTAYNKQRDRLNENNEKLKNLQQKELFRQKLIQLGISVPKPTISYSVTNNSLSVVSKNVRSRSLPEEFGMMFLTIPAMCRKNSACDSFTSSECED